MEVSLKKLLKEWEARLIKVNDIINKRKPKDEYRGRIKLK